MLPVAGRTGCTPVQRNAASWVRKGSSGETVPRSWSVWQGRVWRVMPQVHQARNWLDVGLMAALIHEGPWFPNLKCPPRCSLCVTSRLYPHSLPLPHEPPEGGWEVPRLHAPSGCGGAGVVAIAVFPAAPRVLGPGPSWEVRSLSGAVVMAVGRSEGLAEAPRIQCAYPRTFHWPEGGMWPRPASPLNICSSPRNI